MQRQRRIATEEAFATPEQLEALADRIAAGDDSADAPFWGMMAGSANPFAQRVKRQLLDLDDERLAIMDAEGVDMHVLALTSPGVQMFAPDRAAAMARDSNDRLAELVARHPRRFAGLATIAPQDPEAAALEVERAMGKLGLNGVMINSHTNDEYLDEEKYLPIFEAAAASGAPIYLHPRAPSRGMAGPYLKYGLETAMWGYGAETGLHAVRLIMSGVFDRFPGLRLVLGHMGEGLPFWQWRLDYMFASGSNRPKLELLPGEYMRRNMAITTSGMNWDKALAFCIEAVGIDNIMWAIDYPYQTTPEAVEFMDRAPLSDEDRTKIYAGNAERIFNIAPLADELEMERA
ncbi:amidohydrolase family protein [Sphingosinicella sp. CPCC 101087]|uniref:amidohydrolase family protein n=1 Tax=Sphingosinicella sp. CPCC 101087 TaxID=2497754 RepID=UPI00101D7A98|nr:amidohydrolase family protein [Sphingosinicella sp. CPCC 101087]